MKKFYAQKDALGFPFPGTMMSASIIPLQDNVLEIKEYLGLPQHPQGYKYYIRKDRNGNILPNSLFVSYEPQDSAETIDLHQVSVTTTTTLAPVTTTTTEPVTTTTTVYIPQE